MTKTFYTVSYTKLGSSFKSERIFTDKESAEAFVASHYTDGIETHRVHKPETIEKYEKELAEQKMIDAYNAQLDREQIEI